MNVNGGNEGEGLGLREMYRRPMMRISIHDAHGLVHRTEVPVDPSTARFSFSMEEIANLPIGSYMVKEELFEGDPA